MLNQICKLSVQWTQRNSSRTARRVLTPKRSSSTITLMRKIVEILQNHWKKPAANQKKMWPNAKKCAAGPLDCLQPCLFQPL